MERIINHQFARRNLTKSQIVLSREKVRKKYAEEAKKRLSPGINQYTDRSTVNLPQTTDKKRNPTTDEKIAEKIGVSEKTYRNMRIVNNKEKKLNTIFVYAMLEDVEKLLLYNHCSKETLDRRP